jgi:curved DNA-binding protein
MGPKDYYDILGLEKNTSQKQVRDAYRRLALLHHPDRNKDNPEAADRMKEINEAYAVLSDPQKRSEYDALRQTMDHQLTAGSGRHTPIRTSSRDRTSSRSLRS